MPSIVGWNTYYLTPDEADYNGSATVQLADRSGGVIATVPQTFADDLFIEGSGRLQDGRVVNVSGNHCGPTHYDVAGYQGEPCYSVLPTDVLWGKGVQGRELVPLRTIAVDPNIIPYGSRVYIRQWDGIGIPRVNTRIGPIGGFTHDGWFIAGDTGGFTNRAGSYGHIDIFAGTRAMYGVLERIYPTRSRMDLLVTSGGGLGAFETIALLGIAGAGAWYLYRTLRKKTR